MTSPFQVSIDDHGIAELVFDLQGEKINKLSEETMRQFEDILDELSLNKNIKALIIKSGKKDIFIAGADVKEFGKAFNDLTYADKIIDNGQKAFLKLEKLPFPTIAVINGACLGGGLELALSCTYRIVGDNPKTSLGLPETTLGIIPGWGGTQRLPRLVGLQTGTEMIVTGKPVKASKAYKIHLADAIASPEFLDAKAKEFAKQILTDSGRKKVLARRKKNKNLKSALLEGNPLGASFLFNQFEKGILDKTKGFYPAPLLALNVIRDTYNKPLEEGLKIERESFVKNADKNKDIAKNLIRLFFGQDYLKKSGGYKGDLPKVLDVTDTAVIGAGTMGGGIAWLFANAYIPVRLKDINWDAIGKGLGAAWHVFYKLMKSRRQTPSEVSLKFHEISYTLDYTGFEKKDFIVESAVENLDLKHDIYSELEDRVSDHAIIATNTSSLRISDLNKKMRRPERFIGMHFFNPATRMPLVEIIPHESTPPEVLSKTIELAKKLGKIPLVVGDCHGFLVNRIFMMAAGEAFALLEEGVSIEQLDKAMLDFGMPMGSCELSDEVGNDVTYKVSKVFEESYGRRMKVSPLLEKMYKENLLGKKTGKGFYIYDGKSKKVNPEAQKIVRSFKGSMQYSDDQIRERILLAMINEAAKCLEEKIVEKPNHIDLAMVLGTGFPPFRGGIMAYADSVGLPKIYESLKKLSEIDPDKFTPSPLIVKYASENRNFYEPVV